MVLRACLVTDAGGGCNVRRRFAPLAVLVDNLGMPGKREVRNRLEVVLSRDAEARLAAARQWLGERSTAEPLLVLADGRHAADEVVRQVAGERGALFGWERSSLTRLAADLALPHLAAEGRVPLTATAAEALVARVVHELRERGRLGVFDRVSGGPGLARALAGVVDELRLAGLAPSSCAAVAPDVAAVLEAYELALEDSQFADHATVLSAATELAAGARDLPMIGAPLMILDLRVEHRRERQLLSALVDRADQVFCAAPAGDRRTTVLLRDVFPGDGGTVRDLGESPLEGDSALARLQRNLFGPATDEERGGDESLSILSAPGEARECVEIARCLQQLASANVGFDQMAISLRSPEEYSAHLEEALARAEVPAYFHRTVMRPHPSGRALIALLDCALDGLSARAFAEYLSLGQIVGDEGPKPTAAGLGAADSQLIPTVLQQLADDENHTEVDAAVEDPMGTAVVAGTLRAPRRWERLLSEAAVIGGLERWQRRLGAAEGVLLAEIAANDDVGDPGDPASERLATDLATLRELRRFALPLLGRLAELPPAATWGAWLEHLRALAEAALRRRDSVLALLAELEPMAPIGPVGLDEVRQVLSRRLLATAPPAPASRYGRVLVAPIEALRGLSFEVVFVPGLAERLFPHKISEDPILLDRARRAIDDELDGNEERLADERALLQLAVGAARRSVVLSYPRIDLAHGRPRVPSFYALEALRAAEGRLPSFDELSARAERETGARIGWPAPRDPAEAIDEAEHDLALLEQLRTHDDEAKIGTARFLLDANPHLGRALRFRARRWLRGWTPADGLVRPSKEALEVMRHHQLSARSFSPTALEKYTSCPYQFFLYAVQRLSPREVAEVVDDLDPLRRGSLVHDTQFAFFQALRERDWLPVRSERLDDVLELLDTCLDEQAQRLRDQLVPRIERVWQDAVQSIRADLREWVRRASIDGSGYVPWRFELAFGLRDRGGRDAESVEQAVVLDSGIQLRGSIDLVERNAGGHLRATDHKTGRSRMPARGVIAGGSGLQPVLYALALEKLYGDDRVDSGRLYYCTSTGSFDEREIALDASARKAAADLARVVGESLEIPFLPARPARGACNWCDYRVVCGPYEAQRTARKTKKGTEGLEYLRSLP